MGKSYLLNESNYHNLISLSPRSFYEHGSPESNFVILDPLNVLSNTTKNSFQTHEIIKSFRKAFNKLTSLLLQYQSQQNLNISDNLLDQFLDRESEPHSEVSSDVQTQTTPVQILQQDLDNQSQSPLLSKHLNPPASTSSPPASHLQKNIQ